MFALPAASGSQDALHAVVVPHAGELRRRRIVNVRELIRFELEGLSISLPVHHRLAGFDVTMEPLPRNIAGDPNRHDIRDRYCTGRLRTPAAATPVDDHLARVVALVQETVGPAILVHSWSNLELDLGLDSMDRVTLLASIERRFGVRIPEEIAQGAFTVRELAEAVRGTSEATACGGISWASLLEENSSPPGSVAAEAGRGLLKPRTLTAVLVYALVRVLIGTLIRPRVSGLEHLPRQGPFIITPNHQSYIDPLVVESVLPFGVFRQLFFVGAAEYFETALTRWLARALNIVPVDPDANLLPAMQAGAFGLKHGKVLMLFPEGERSIDGTVKTFRKGAAILSQHLGVPIVPVAIDGVFEIWPRNRPLDWKRLLPWSGHRANVRFGRPIEAPKRECSYEEHTTTVRAEVERLWLDRDREVATRSSVS